MLADHAARIPPPDPLTPQLCMTYHIPWLLQLLEELGTLVHCRYAPEVGCKTGYQRGGFRFVSCVCCCTGVESLPNEVPR